MPDVDGLNIFGDPLIALPEDWGDGPFFTNAVSPDTPRASFADVAELFGSGEPFEETWLTDMPV